jgi:hypothetical protein
MQGHKISLLPVQGSDTQWYNNVLKNPEIRINARGVEAEFWAMPITETNAVKSVGREIPGEVRGEGREEVLLEIRCGGCGGAGRNSSTSGVAFSRVGNWAKKSEGSLPYVGEHS